MVLALALASGASRASTSVATIALTPAEDFDATGGPGGPFAPSQKTYTLANLGTSVVRWGLVENAPWLVPGRILRGRLDPGQTKHVTLSFASSAAQLSAGTHSTTVTFVDLDSSALLASLDVHLTIDASTGWTALVPSVDTRTVYVSRSTGSDANDGLSPATPKASVAAGAALLRHGYPDWLLLRRGDVWQESLGQWKKSGRSATERMVITSYGTSPDRPLLQTGTGDGITSGSWGGSPPRIDHVALVGVHFQPHLYTGGQGTPMGVAWRVQSDDFLIEDCFFERYYQNVVVEPLNGRSSSFAIRRSVVVDAFTTSTSHAQGMYLYGIDGVEIEENLFDHNGWSETVSGAAPTIFRHNVYVQSGTYGVEATGNIIANGGSHGLQLRSGGVAKDNLFVRNSIALLLGGGNTPDPAGVTAEATDNVILEGKNIDASNPRGWGIDLTNVATARVSANVIANQALGTSPIAINLYGNAEGVHQTTIDHNVIRNWGGPILIQGGPPTLTDAFLFDNVIQDQNGTHPLVDQSSSSSSPEIGSARNVFYSRLLPASSWMRVGGANLSLASWKSQVGDTTSSANQAAFPAPDRSVATYNASLGGSGSSSAFLTEARKQSRSNWRPQYTAAAVNDYIRQGFAVVTN